MSEETCLAVATPFITQRMGDPESVIFENLKCYRGLEGRVPVARVEATYGYRFAGDVDSKGEIGRYTGMTPFSGIVRDDGDGPKVVRYCITSGTKDYRFCIPSMVDWKAVLFLIIPALPFIWWFIAGELPKPLSIRALMCRMDCATLMGVMSQK